MRTLGALTAALVLSTATMPASFAADNERRTATPHRAHSSILPVRAPSGVTPADVPTLSQRKAAATASKGPRVSAAFRAIRVPGVPARIDGSGITVAVVDSGVEALLPNLHGQVLPGKDFNKAPTARGWHDPVSFGGHGTGVASIIVGKGRGTGVRGVAPGARILPVRVANKWGSAPDERIARAIRWAVTQHVDVINLSMGDTKPNAALNASIRYAVRKGVIFIAGAGNDGPTNATPFYPAAIPAAIAVGGTRTKSDVVAGFSCRGDWVDLVAPATWVPNTNSDGTIGLANGTSFAAPFVAGVAALMLQANPNLDQDGVRRILTQTARDIDAPGFDANTGHGILNAAAAVKRARGVRRGQ